MRNREFEQLSVFNFVDELKTEIKFGDIVCDKVRHLSPTVII